MIRSLISLYVLAACSVALPTAAAAQASNHDDAPRLVALRDLWPIDAVTMLDDLEDELSETVAATPALTPARALQQMRQQLDQQGGAAATAVLRKAGLAQNVGALRLIAASAVAQRRTAAAMAALLLAAEHAPGDAAVLNDLAAVTALLGMPNEALALLPATGPAPAGGELNAVRRAAWFNNRGYALLRVGHWAAAESALKQAVQIAPRMSEARRNLAVSLVKQDRRGEAERVLAASVRATAKPLIEAGNDDPVCSKPGGQPDADLECEIIVSVPLDELIDPSHGTKRALAVQPRPNDPAMAMDNGLRVAAELEVWSQQQMPAMLAEISRLRAAAARDADPFTQQFADIIIRRIAQEMGIFTAALLPADELPPLDPAIRAAALDYRAARKNLRQGIAHSHEQLQARVAGILNNASMDSNARCRALYDAKAGQLRTLVPLVAGAETAFRTLFDQAYRRATALAARVGHIGYHETLRAIMAFRAESEEQALKGIVAGGYAEAGHPPCSDDNIADEAAAAEHEATDLKRCPPGVNTHSPEISLGIVSVRLTCEKVEFEVGTSPGGKALEQIREGGLDFGAFLKIEMDLRPDGDLTIYGGAKGALGVSPPGMLGGSEELQSGFYLTVSDQEGIKDVGWRVSQSIKTGPEGFKVALAEESTDFSFVAGAKVVFGD